MIAALFALARKVSPTAWAVIAILAAFLIFGAYCAQRGAEGLWDRQAAKSKPRPRRSPPARAKRLLARS